MDVVGSLIGEKTAVLGVFGAGDGKGGWSLSLFSSGGPISASTGGVSRLSSRMNPSMESLKGLLLASRAWLSSETGGFMPKVLNREGA